MVLNLEVFKVIRSKYFYMKKVYDKEGKYLGIIEDLVLDFFCGKIIGFKLSLSSLFSKKNFVPIDKVISINEKVIIEESVKFNGLYFKDIKRLEILNLNGHMLGVLEDLIINRENYNIVGLIVSTGIIEEIIKGKKIFLIEDCILGEQSIMYIGNKNIELKILAKGLVNREDGRKEKA